ncbi:bifunctional pyr operon transcriptional regulator/uracil phosphoribosyltransferase PyrR [Undibacterium sp. Rencai35W]|uniref:bifunctional pyr operon transcriptional regulator/uracil phosphoribosyltransferase PyrR n=1 Tax=Undibacterium sp. Rencai35W TaxID=3413046 RepID=UPI003BEFEF73
MTSFTQLPDAETLYQQLLTQIKARVAADEHLAIVGIYSGGAWLAERLVGDLGLKGKPGFIDVSFYRDDYAAKGLHAEVKPSQIPFDVDGASIILVDDVLYTGRTTRAAINELFDYGRPAKIMLAALVDRGGRELPIAADFVAHTAEFEKNCSVNLQRADGGQLSFSIDHA